MYNGWTNYETWNVALWIENDESLYNIAKGAINYTDFRDIVTGFEGGTPDSISYFNTNLDIDALDKLIKEI